MLLSNIGPLRMFLVFSAANFVLQKFSSNNHKILFANISMEQWFNIQNRQSIVLNMEACKFRQYQSYMGTSTVCDETVSIHAPCIHWFPLNERPLNGVIIRQVNVWLIWELRIPTRISHLKIFLWSPVQSCKSHFFAVSTLWVQTWIKVVVRWSIHHIAC